MKELTKSNFDETINQNKLVLVDFWAAWCGPCRMVQPVLEELASEAGDMIDFCKLNVDGYPEFAARYGIRNIPNMLIFKNGEVVDRIVGAVPKSHIQSKLQEYL